MRRLQPLVDSADEATVISVLDDVGKLSVGNIGQKQNWTIRGGRCTRRVHEFSMHPGLLLEVREAVNSFDRSLLIEQAKPLLRAMTREGILHVLERLKKCSAVSTPAIAPA